MDKLVISTHRERMSNVSVLILACILRVEALSLVGSSLDMNVGLSVVWFLSMHACTDDGR